MSVWIGWAATTALNSARLSEPLLSLSSDLKAASRCLSTEALRALSSLTWAASSSARSAKPSLFASAPTNAESIRCMKAVRAIGCGALAADAVCALAGAIVAEAIRAMSERRMNTLILRVVVMVI